MFSRIAICLALMTVFPAIISANSRVIGLRNNFNSSLDQYRSSEPAYKCSAFDNARTYADLVMREGADASLARQWNSMLPSTGCGLTPLIIDQTATNESSNPEPNQESKPKDDGSTSQEKPLATGSCLPFQDMISINMTREVYASCQGGGSIFIKAH